MTFATPTPNTHDLHRTATRDAFGRRVVVKEVARNGDKWLSIITDGARLTLSQNDAAQLATLLHDYAEHGTIG